MLLDTRLRLPKGPERTSATSPDTSQATVRRMLLGAWERLGVGEVNTDAIGGQLLRPRFALDAVPHAERKRIGERFWLAALAVQLAHEASLIHDDVVDRAEIRRDHPTLFERQGVGAALIAGDQMLARAYLAAARTGSTAFTEAFALAVERTIQGEREQGKVSGRRIDPEHGRSIARAKSGELFGCALSAHAVLEDSPSAGLLAELGRDLGLLYQRVDDLLDFCPGAGTGKPPFADLASGLWTWPRDHLLPEDAPSDEDADPTTLFRRRTDGAVPALEALASLEDEGERLLSRIAGETPYATLVRTTVNNWIGRASLAVHAEVGARDASEQGVVPEQGAVLSGAGEGPESSEEPKTPPATARRPWSALPDATDPEIDPREILAKHGRSFHFATRLMPDEVMDPVARLYAFCRRVDDTVDRAPDPVSAERALDALERETRRAYAGCTIRDASVAAAVNDMHTAGVSFDLAEALFEGVRMDLRPRRYADLAELRVYTYRVAGVVGLWMAGLARCTDPWALRMATELGHAMQLTNIVRDVGADLGMGRLYLPLDLLERHHLTEEGLLALADDPSAGIPVAYSAALEELMGSADAGYGAAFQAIPSLPDGFRGAVAVAARVYQGIHDEIRGIGYDTLRDRAHTGPIRKGLLAIGALRELRSAVSRHET